MIRLLFSVFYYCSALMAVLSLTVSAQEKVAPDAAIHSPPEAISSGDENKDPDSAKTGSKIYEYRDLDDLFSLYQPYLENISAYNPIYFLLGTELEKSKYQFSFKYRLFNPTGSWSKKHAWFKGFHLAYTQTSFWDLASESKPFEDTSYKPEAFFLTSNFSPWERGHFFVRTGYQHESNGKSGMDSRARDIVYVKPILILYSEKTMLGLQFAPQAWGYLSNETDSLENYRGYFDLEVKLGRADSFVLETHSRWAKQGGSFRLDLTYPVHRYIFNNLNFYLHFQYANSLAENLINYEKRIEAFRFGIALIR